MDKNEMRLKNKALYRDSKGEDNLAVLAYDKLQIPPRQVTVTTAPGGAKDIHAYSIVMAAEALGKSVIQMRTWIDKGYIPQPKLRVLNHGYRVYDSDEMEIIRKHLYEQTTNGVSYLTDNTVGFVDTMFAEVYKHREEKYGR